MDRYEFEDLISEYVENSLPLTKRKEFEAYLKADPKSQLLVEQVRTTIDQLKNLQKVKVSDHFNERLMARIKNRKSAKLPYSASGQNWVLGFTPLYASLMTGLAIAFLFISLQLFFPSKSDYGKENQFYVNDSSPDIKSPNTTLINHDPKDLTAVEDDSLDANSSKSRKKDYSKRIKLVKK